MLKLVGRDEVARVFNCSPRWISGLVERGMPKMGRGEYDLGHCMLWYIRYLQKELERREVWPDDPTGVNLRKERLRLVKAQADREEHELSQKRAELVPPEVIADCKREEYQRVRRAACAMVDELVPQLEGQNRIMIKARIDDAVRDMLNRLAECVD